MRYTKCLRGCGTRWCRRSWRRYSMDAMVRIRADVKRNRALAKDACGGTNARGLTQDAPTDRKE